MKAAEIRVNGEKRPLTTGATIESLLDSLGLDSRAVAVEHNGAIVRRPAYDTTPLGHGDQLEIVRFVQGG